MRYLLDFLIGYVAGSMGYAIGNALGLPIVVWLPVAAAVALTINTYRWRHEVTA